MHLETLIIGDSLKPEGQVHSFASKGNAIRKWTLLPAGLKSSTLLDFAALACTGRNHVQTLLAGLPRLASGPHLPAQIEFVLVRDSPQECGPCQARRHASGWHLPGSGAIRALDASERRFLERTIPHRQPISGGGNAGWCLLGYGREIKSHEGTDTFHFADPHHRLRRLGSLFNPESRLTDPLAFLERLHCKGVLYEKPRSGQFIRRLNRELSPWLQIEPEAWLAKRFDFRRWWPTLPGWRQIIAGMVLDAARHLLDAAIKKPEPFEQSGLMLLDGMDRWCPRDSLTPFAVLLDRLFPRFQFILTLPRPMHARFPVALMAQEHAVPAPRKRAPHRARTHLPPGTVLLIDVDSSLPNLALMKLSRHLKETGHSVALARRNDRPVQADKAYASCVFAFPQSARRVTALREFYGPRLELGGSGVDIQRRLPPAIEELPADYSLYPELGDRALGFLTRGCPLHCPFCIVPIKEGKPRQVSDLDSLLQGRKKLILLDDNLLSHRSAVPLMEEMLRRDLAVNFNQTLDLRLLTPETARLLQQIRCSNVSFTRRNYYFSLNNTRFLDLARQRYALLNVNSGDNVEFVCMYGFDTTLAEDVERFRFLRSLPGAYVFLQRYRPVLNGPEPDLTGFFDERAEEQIDALLQVNFTQNMKSMEVYYRWVCLLYAQQRGRVHRKLLETLFRYNRRQRMGDFLIKLEKIAAHGTGITRAASPFISG